MSTELRGPDGLRHDISTFLRTWVPAHARAAELAWGLEPMSIETPVDAPTDARTDGYFDREPAAIDRWPMISISTGRMRQAEVARDYDTPDPILTSTYPVRVFSWVKAEGWDVTQDLRDRLGTVIRIAVLSHLQLGTDYMLVRPSTVVLDFSRVEKVTGDRFVAGSFVGFDVEATETLTDRLTMPGAPARDTVAGVIAAGTVLPPVPQETP